MKFLLPSFFLSLLLSSQSFAQSPPYFCGALLPPPALTAGFENPTAQALNSQTDAASSAGQAADAGDSIYRAQVVFHIVYANDTQNVPDSVIIAQMEVLNADFRRHNADTDKTRNIFKPIAADAGIEFYLATQDPSGNPTTGILHIPTTNTAGFSQSAEAVKKTSTGGDDPWPTDRYVNVWVCRIVNPLGLQIGYSYPPIGTPHWPNVGAFFTTPDKVD